MAYNLKTKSIYYPKNYKIYFNNGLKGKFTKELFELNNNILKNILDTNSSLIYVIYLPINNENFMKIGYAKSTRDFIKKDGRFDIHTKSFKCERTPVLLRVFKIKEKEKEQEIELRLHRYIKENYRVLHFKVPFMKDGNECKSNETYFFDKNLFNDIGNIIQSICYELHPLSKSAKTNLGYISDKGFIDNKIIYDRKRKLELENIPKVEIEVEVEVEKNFKFKPQDEKDETNLEKYSGYENEDGFIVDDEDEISDNVSESSLEYESSESEPEQKQKKPRKRLIKHSKLF
jgi:hypothetical protein